MKRNPNAPCLRCGQPVGTGVGFCNACLEALDPNARKAGTGRPWWRFWSRGTDRPERKGVGDGE